MNKNKVSRVVIFGNVHRIDIDDELKLLIDFCNQRDIIVLTDEYLHSYLSKDINIDSSNIEVIKDNNFEADLVLSIGGDGTFLNSAARVGKKGFRF